MSFLYSQLFVTPPKPTARVDGKTVIVTGSNVGLGKEAARHFASLGASTLIIAVRSLEKGNAAKADIESTTKISKDVIQVWQLDLSSYESVKEFAKRVEGLPRVDIVVENAAIATEEWRTAEDNEATITVNVVSTFLLALLILPKLKQTASKFNVCPMLTIVSSEVHGWATFKERDAPEGKIFEQLNDKSKANMGDRYMVSKLLEVLAIRAIVERNPANSYPVTINSVNPGLCHS
jgi:NAD(P)-dependent dehydrogenase (short-subunit alcohol dehydrogenase family)